MKEALRNLLTESTFTVFHICMTGIFFTGVMVASSASDLGPFEPLLVAGGIIGCFFSVTCEILFVVRACALAVIKKIGKEKVCSSV